MENKGGKSSQVREKKSTRHGINRRVEVEERREISSCLVPLYNLLKHQMLLMPTTLQQ